MCISCLFCLSVLSLTPRSQAIFSHEKCRLLRKWTCSSWIMIRGHPAPLGIYGVFASKGETFSQNDCTYTHSHLCNKHLKISKWCLINSMSIFLMQVILMSHLLPQAVVGSLLLQENQFQKSADSECQQELKQGNRKNSLAQLYFFPLSSCNSKTLSKCQTFKDKVHK